MSLTLAIEFARTNGRLSFRHRSIRVGRQIQRFEHRSIFYNHNHGRRRFSERSQQNLIADCAIRRVVKCRLLVDPYIGY